MDEIARDQDLSIRRLRDEPEDYRRMVGWLAAPHVKEWWDPDEPALTFDDVVEKYGSRSNPDSPTTCCVIELDGRPVGYIQFYPWEAFDEEARGMDVSFDEGTFGLDVLVGEPELVGTGIGSRAVDLLCRHLFEERGASAVALITELGNLRAQRAYERAGFGKVRQVLDTDTRGGERVRCWLMVRERGGS